MKTIIFAFAVLVATISHGECKQCPSVTTLPDFDYARWSARTWYSLYETSPPRLPCLHYATVPDAAGNLNMTFLPYHIPLAGARKDPNDITKGFTMNINFPALNGADFNIIDTDYDNWALIFNCKEADPVAGSDLFYSGTALGRTRTMDPANLTHIEGIMDAKGINRTTIQQMIQPNTVCNIAETLFGPALKYFLANATL